MLRAVPCSSAGGQLY